MLDSVLRKRAEWVIAPTEMRSTLVSAIARTVARFTPPLSGADFKTRVPDSSHATSVGCASALSSKNSRNRSTWEALSGRETRMRKMVFPGAALLDFAGTSVTASTHGGAFCGLEFSAAVWRRSIHALSTLSCGSAAVAGSARWNASCACSVAEASRHTAGTIRRRGNMRSADLTLVRAHL